MSDLEKVNGHHAKELLSLPFAAALEGAGDPTKFPFDVDGALASVVVILSTVVSHEPFIDEGLKRAMNLGRNNRICPVGVN